MNKHTEKTIFTFTHRCKFDTESKLPLCPIAYRLCHSPCDLLSATGQHALAATVDAPDGVYQNGKFPNLMR
jgi:hypothetical protein